MKEFMFLIRNQGDGKADMSPEQLLQFHKACEVYIEELRKKGNLKSAQVLGFERGPYSVNDNRITFTQREHSLEFTSTCNSSLNSNKNLPLTTESYSFEIVHGQYGQEMVLTDGKSRWRFNRAQ